MLGSVISCLICLIPAAIAFSVVYFLMQMASGPFAAFPVGCAAATLVLLAEAAGGIFLLGWLFERFRLFGRNLTFGPHAGRLGKGKVAFRAEPMGVKAFNLPFQAEPATAHVREIRCDHHLGLQPMIIELAITLHVCELLDFSGI